MLKRFFIVVGVLGAVFLGVAAGLAVISRSHVYRGPNSEPAAWNPNASRSRIVEEARKLVGIWYDPVQGYFNDIGGKWGFIVCMDVPRIAYRNSGASIRRLLEADYKLHPDHYGKRDGQPGDPYFDRRARNLYSFCKFNGCLSLKGPPEPGDVVFMSHSETGWITHIALVSSVGPDGKYQVIEASRDDWYVTREEDGEILFKRGWVFRGFGQPLRVKKLEGIAAQKS